MAKFQKGNKVGRRFGQGQDNKRGGRKPKLPQLDILLAEVLGEDEDKNRAKEILTALHKKAVKGDVRAAEVLLDRAYGKAQQQVSFSGTPEFIIRVIDEDPI